MTYSLMRQKQIEEELYNFTNWKPNLTLISKKTGIPISSVYDHYKRSKKIHNKKVKENLKK